MELDQLKDPWRRLDDAPPLRMDLPSLLERAERAAARPLRRMKRRVIGQAISLVGIYVVAFTQFQGPERIPVGIFYIVMMLTAAVYYRKKYRLLKGMERIRADEDMVTNFSEKLGKFKRMLALEQWITVILLEIVMWFVCWLLWAYQRHDFYDFAGIKLHPGQEVLVVLCWTACGVVLSWPAWFATWAANLQRYGRYINDLEKTLNELNQ